MSLFILQAQKQEGMISDYMYINIELNEIIKQGAYDNCISFSNGVCNPFTLPRKERN
jgi:hypothetical protein